MKSSVLCGCSRPAPIALHLLQISGLVVGLTISPDCALDTYETVHPCWVATSTPELESKTTAAKTFVRLPLCDEYTTSTSRSTAARGRLWPQRVCSVFRRRPWKTSLKTRFRSKPTAPPRGGHGGAALGSAVRHEQVRSFVRKTLSVPAADCDDSTGRRLTAPRLTTSALPYLIQVELFGRKLFSLPASAPNCCGDDPRPSLTAQTAHNFGSVLHLRCKLQSVRCWHLRGHR